MEETRKEFRSSAKIIRANSREEKDMSISNAQWTSILTQQIEMTDKIFLRVARLLSAEQWSYKITENSNPFAFLLMHAKRWQDEGYSKAAGVEAVFRADNWYQEFGLDPLWTGYNIGNEQASALVVDPETAIAYAQEVSKRAIYNITRMDPHRVNLTAEYTPGTVRTILEILAGTNVDTSVHAGQTDDIGGALFEPGWRV